MEPDARSRYSPGMKSDQTRQIEEMITSGRALVRQAQEALDAAHRFFVENGIDPEAAEADLRRIGGQKAVDAVHAEVRARIKAIEEAVWRDQVHAPSAGKPGPRRRLVRSMI